MNPKKAVFCWSGGKDSAYCLDKVLSEQLYDIKYLLTTINDKYNRISMHGVREKLLEMQTASVGIELLKVPVIEGTNAEYERQMESVLLKVKSEGIKHVIFGDIFLEDLRVYREKNLEKIGMCGIFPIWKLDTKWLINNFISKGYKTITCCTNDYLGEKWVGREIDSEFVNQLPENVDPCGENGEFHTFCYEGPLFKKKIGFSIGEKVYKAIEAKKDNVCCSLPQLSNIQGFWFCDLIPQTQKEPSFSESVLEKILL